MNKNISSLLEKISPEEQLEVENFINFLIIKKKLNKQKVSSDDISVKELTNLAEKSGGFDWLDDEAQNIYSISDGVPVQW